MPIVSTNGPNVGICPKATFVSVAPAVESMSGLAIMELTRTNPVIAHITTVSQKGEVELTNAWRTGFFVRAAAATIGALPSPLSFEKSPRAIP